MSAATAPQSAPYSNGPSSPLDNAVARLVRQYEAKGDLELHFVRQIAAAALTLDSLQRTIDTLVAAIEIDERRLDRISRVQMRTQRQQVIALKELKDLQDRRNLRERFQDQTKDCPPLADHTAHVGDPPMIHPISVLKRGRMFSPTDHTPRVTTQFDPEKFAKGIPQFKQIIPDPNAKPNPKK